MTTLIKSKASFYDLYKKGVFGNGLLIWDSISLAQDFYINNPDALFGLRYSGISGGGRFVTELTWESLLRTYESWVSEGLEPSKIILCEALPRDAILFHGEVMENPDWNLHYNSESFPNHRAAMKNPKYLKGLSARIACEHYMDESSYENLQRLLSEYPGAVIEFTCTKYSLGTNKWNTIFWEVRHY